MAKKIITIGKKGVTERVQGLGKIDSYSIDYSNLEDYRKYTVGNAPEDNFSTIQEAVNQWVEDGASNYPIFIRPRLDEDGNEQIIFEDIILPDSYGYNSDNSFKPIVFVGLDINTSYTTVYGLRPIWQGSIRSSNTDGIFITLKNMAIRTGTGVGFFDDALSFGIFDSCYFIMRSPLLSTTGSTNNISKIFKFYDTNILMFSSSDVLIDISTEGNNSGITTSFSLRNCERIGRKDKTFINCSNLSGTNSFISYNSIIDGKINLSQGVSDSLFYADYSTFSAELGNDESHILVNFESTTNNIKINNCTINTEGNGTENAVFDFNTDAYVNATIENSSMGTGFLATSRGLNSGSWNLNYNISAGGPLDNTTLDSMVNPVTSSVSL